MAFSYEAQVRLACPPYRAFALAGEALRQIGLTIRTTDIEGGVILARKGISFTSYGHDVRVVLSGPFDLDSSDTGIAVRSDSRGPRMNDWGANEKLVLAFESALHNLIADQGATNDSGLLSN